MTQSPSDQTQIEQLVGKYIEAINQSNTDAIVPLFAADGVLMAADAPTMAGPQELKPFFDQAFRAIRLSATIFFDEIVVHGHYAYARTHSRVNVTLVQNDTSHDEENRELFLLNKDDGTWKIARYMFNKLPARK